MTYPWNAGDILTAADLNAEFGSKLTYPSGGADGDALIKSGTSAAWGAAGGLTLITSESFSAVSSVQVNGVFSADYENYQIFITLTGSTAESLLWRVAAGGTPNSGTNYAHQQLRVGATSVTAARNTSVTSGRFGTVNTGLGAIDATIFRPFLAVQTKAISQCFDPTDTVRYEAYASNQNQSTSYDGLVLFPGSGTITGEFRIYGLRI
jgi:hypothetical protein